MNKITAVLNVMLVVALVLGSAGVAVAESQKVIINEEMVWSEYSGFWSGYGDRIYLTTYSDGSAEYRYIYAKSNLLPAYIYAVQPITITAGQGQDVTVTLVLNGISCSLGSGGTHSHTVDFYFGEGSARNWVGRGTELVPCGEQVSTTFTLPNSYFGSTITIPGTYMLAMEESTNVAGTVYKTSNTFRYITVTDAAPTPTPSTGTGDTGSGSYITINSNMLAGVYIDNVAVGTTGKTYSVRPGGHDIKVTQSGYTTYSTSISVDYGATATVNAQLSAASPTPAQTTPPPPASTGTILIWSNPAGAQVIIDSASAGTTSANWLQVSKPPGTYQVSIQMSGYTPFTQSVSVTSGQYSTVQATLTAVVTGTATATATATPPPSQNCGAGLIFSTTYNKCVPDKAPQGDKPATTLSQIIQGIANWLITWLTALTISGPDTVSLGAGAQTFSISTTASEQPKSDYNDGTYSELWGTWMVVDSNQNIVAQRNPTWVKLTSGTFTDTATATFNNKGSYAVVDVIIKVPYTYTSGAWVKGAETIVGKDQQAVKVAIPSPASQAATSGAGSPPQGSLTSWLKSIWDGLWSWLGL